MTTETISKKCPHCGAQMPVHFGFITWCDRCSYNLEDTVETGEQKPKGMFPRLWAWMGKRSEERLYREALAVNDYHPRLSISIVLAFALALVIHGFTLFLALTAAYWLFLAARGWGTEQNLITFAHILGAAVLLLLVWKVRPHLGGLEKDTVRRDQAEQEGLGPLFALADRISEHLGAPRIRAISIRPTFTAGIGQKGWRREPELMLGLPLAVTLERQELVGLLGHEIAHLVNKDPQRTWLVESAIHTLIEWSDVFFIDRFPDSTAETSPMVGFFTMLIQIVTRLLSLFAWLAGFLMALLVYPNIQRAEYRADVCAARLAGTDAMVRLLHRLYLSNATVNIFRKTMFFPETRLMQEIRDRLCAVPEREWRRIEQVIEKGESRLTDTHPTTKDRLAVLKARSKEMGQVALTTAELSSLMEGLRRFDEKVETEVRREMQKVRSPMLA